MKPLIKWISCFYISLFYFISGAIAQPPTTKQFVDSIYKTLSTEEKIAQLFMVAAYSGTNKYNMEDITELVAQYQIGGLIFMQGTAAEQARHTNILQQISKTPLLIGMDAEWGIGMRLKGIKDLPKQMTIGATRDTNLMYKIGEAIALQCQRLGVHINFAPSIDINNNHKNPVIGFRSFGANKELVSQMGIQYTKALQKNNVLACAKHFPGHGDVTVDSHEDLPTIDKNKNSLQSLELYPFQQLIHNHVASIMVAHLNLPLLEPNHIPSTLSKNIITDLLINEMQFDGLIITDALNMKGVTKNEKSGVIELRAFLAGNDILLFPENVAQAIEIMSQAYDDGVITEERLEKSVKKILSKKYELGLYQFSPISIDEKNIDIELNAQYEDIMYETAEKAITLYKKNKYYNKFKEDKEKTIITFYAKESQLNLYKNAFPNANIINIDESNAKNAVSLISKYTKAQPVFINLHQLSRYPGSHQYYGYSDECIKALSILSENNKAIFAIHGVPYIAQHFCKAQNIIIGYEDHIEFQKFILKVISSPNEAKGKIPVSICQ
jgi:beta-N-acetylhexosaminidase